MNLDIIPCVDVCPQRKKNNNYNGFSKPTNNPEFFHPNIILQKSAALIESNQKQSKLNVELIVFLRFHWSMISAHSTVRIY